MSYQSVRQQLLLIAAQPLPTSKPKPTLDDVVDAARGLGWERVEHHELGGLFDPEPTLYERIKDAVRYFVYVTVPKLTAGV